MYFGEYKSTETQWIAFHVTVDSVTYFDNFGAEHIPKEIKKFIGNKNIIRNFYITETNDSMICFHIGLIDFMLEVCQSIPIHFLLTNMERITK